MINFIEEFENCKSLARMQDNTWVIIDFFKYDVIINHVKMVLIQYLRLQDGELLFIDCHEELVSYIPIKDITSLYWTTTEAHEYD